MKLSNQNYLVIALVVLVVLWYLKNQAGKAVDAAVTAVNPADQGNLANRLANEGLWRGGSDGVGTLGTDFYDWTHDDERWWN
ncbi:MAG: hypothetical protein KA296_13765 [Marinobacter sp.]|nr:hypothetical protein [Marinobacter sp.]